MKLKNDQLTYSATDLVGFLNCESLTAFNKAVALGKAKKPKVWSPLLEVLWERGLKHEKEYIDFLSQQNLSIVSIDGIEITDEAIARTLDAMKAGTDVIIQAALRDGDWVGRADVLIKTTGESDLGSWLYEPVDTKLARETKAGSVIQLCLYAELLKAMQGIAPHNMAIIVCRWRENCSMRRREDDHLSLVANLSKAQQIELKANGIDTLAGLANAPLPLEFEPSRGSVQSLEKAREQARVQLASRGQKIPVYEVLEHQEGFGLSQLPEPSEGDVFLDFEGDPFVGDGGLEYLTGYVFLIDGEWKHEAVWALDRTQERKAFEDFVDFIIDRKTQFPDMHIYHYAPYEPAALKRLMGRYASKEEEIDQLLRTETFVDLYSIVRSAIRAGVESYSIKKLEPIFGYERVKPMHEANLALAKLQGDLELGRPKDVSSEIMDEVQAYNYDDCFSTLVLRNWLETVRDDQINNGVEITRPEIVGAEISDKLSEWIERVNELVHKLTNELPADFNDWTDEHIALWVLAHTLDFHRREAKSLWWEFFRLRDLSADDLISELVSLLSLREKEEPTELQFIDIVSHLKRQIFELVIP